MTIFIKTSYLLYFFAFVFSNITLQKKIYEKQETKPRKLDGLNKLRLASANYQKIVHCAMLKNREGYKHMTMLRRYALKTLFESGVPNSIFKDHLYGGKALLMGWHSMKWGAMTLGTKYGF